MSKVSAIMNDKEPDSWNDLKINLCIDEPTWRCRQNPSIGALRIQEPVNLREPQIKG